MSRILLQKTKNGKWNASNARGNTSYADLQHRTDIHHRTGIPPHNISTQLGKNDRIIPSMMKVSACKSPLNPSDKKPMQAIMPTQLHHDVKLICNKFGITEQSKYVLRIYDVTKLDNSCLMTVDNFDELVLSEAHMGRSICPLQ